MKVVREEITPCIVQDKNLLDCKLLQGRLIKFAPYLAHLNNFYVPIEVSNVWEVVHHGVYIRCNVLPLKLLASPSKGQKMAYPILSL